MMVSQGQVSVRLSIEGADDVIRAVRSVYGEGSALEKQIQRGLVPALTAAEKEFKKLERQIDPLVGATERLEKSQKALRSALDAGMVSQARYDQLLGIVKAKHDALAGSTTALTKNFRSSQYAVQQAGYQIGDFAVQVASGQNAIVALTQQGTQLLGVFGSVGAIIGAVAGIAGAAYLAFDRVGDSSEDAARSQDILTDALRQSREITAEVKGDFETLIRLRAEDSLKTLEQARSEQVRIAVLAEAQRQQLLTLDLGLLGNTRIEPSQIAVPGDARKFQELSANIEKYRDNIAKINEGISSLSIKVQAEIDNEGKKISENADKHERRGKVIDEAARAQQRLLEGLAKFDSSLDVNIANLLEQNAALGISVEQYDAVVAAQKREQEVRALGLDLASKEAQVRIAELEQRDALIAAQKAQQEAYKQAAQVRKENEAALQKQAEEAARRAEKVTDDILRAANIDFFDVLGGKSEDFWDGFAKLGKDTFNKIAQDAILRPIIQPVAQSVVGGFGSGLGASAVAGSGGGGLAGIGSSLASGVSSSLLGQASSALFTSIAPSLFAPAATGSTLLVGGAAGGALGAGATTASGTAAAGGALAGAAPFILPAIALALPFILGALGPKPSNKEGNAVLGLDSFKAVVGGAQNASKENKDAASGLAGAIAQYTQVLERISGKDIAGSVRVGFGNRDGIYFERGQGANNTEFGPANATRQVFEASENGVKQLTNTLIRDFADELGGGLSDALKTAIERIDFSAQDALSKLEFAANFDDLFGLNAKSIGPVEAAFEGLNAQAKAFVQTAKELGLSIESVNAQADKARTKLFADTNKALDDQIFALTDPTGAQAKAIRDAAQAAIADNRAVGNIAAIDKIRQLEVLQLQALYADNAKSLLKEQLDGIEKQLEAQERLGGAAQAMIDSINGLQQSRLFGSASNLSNTDRYNYALGLVQNLEGRVAAGDSSVTFDQINNAAQLFDQASLALYAQTGQQSADFDRISKLLDGSKGLAKSQLDYAKQQTDYLKTIADKIGIGGDTVANAISGGYSLGKNPGLNASILTVAPELLTLLPGGFGSSGFNDAFLRLGASQQEMIRKLIDAAPKNAVGGSYVVDNGRAFGDTTLATLRVNRGERIDVTPAGAANGNNAGEGVRELRSQLKALTEEVRMLTRIVAQSGDAHLERLDRLVMVTRDGQFI